VYVSSSTATSRPTPNLSVPDLLVVKTSLSGKGLYATRPIKAGTGLFTEKPFVWVPSIEVVRGIQRGETCAYCGKVFGSMGQSLRVHCKHCNHGTYPPFPEPVLSLPFMHVVKWSYVCSVVFKDMCKERRSPFRRKQIPLLSPS
jgi:hypothetical protein